MVARLMSLGEVLSAAGLTVHHYDGWKTRGADDFGITASRPNRPIRGITCHGTASAHNSSTADDLRAIAITGSETAVAPISQLFLERNGHWWIVASGRCNHNKNGVAGPNKGFGNGSLLGIEAQHGKNEPWTPTQYESYVHGVAALVDHKEPGYDVMVDHVAGHYEHQPNDKTDPWFDMDQFRAQVKLIGGDMLTAQDIDTLLGADAYYRDARNISLATVLTTIFERLGGLTGVDRLTVIEDKISALPGSGVDVAALAEALKPHIEAAAEAAVRKALEAQIPQQSPSP